VAVAVKVLVLVKVAIVVVALVTVLVFGCELRYVLHAEERSFVQYFER
jgi:hypothetical protein